MELTVNEELEALERASSDVLGTYKRLREALIFPENDWEDLSRDRYRAVEKLDALYDSSAKAAAERVQEILSQENITRSIKLQDKRKEDKEKSKLQSEKF